MAKLRDIPGESGSFDPLGSAAAVSAEVSTERVARETIDAALTSGIEAEISARKATDTSIEGSVTSEISARKIAITSEETRAKAAEKAAETNSDKAGAAATAETNAKAAAKTEVKAEETRAKAAEITALPKNCIVTTPEEFGAKRDGVTDDTSAIRTAINEAVDKGTSNKTNYAEVLFTTGTYLVNGSFVKGGSTKGCAIIPLPVMEEIGPGFTLVLKGDSDASPINYYLTKSNEHRGVILKTTKAGEFTELGAASVIGGPTPQGMTGGVFSNMLVTVDGIMIEQPKNPSLLGFDFRKVSEVNIISAAALVAATPKALSEERPSNELGIGLYMPLAGNGNNSNVKSWTAEGYYYPIAFSDHFNADRILAVWCKAGPFVAEPGLHSQGAIIKYLSVVACGEGIVVQEVPSTTFPLTIGMFQAEEIEKSDIVDKANTLVGTIGFNEGEFGRAPVLTESKRVIILDMNNGLAPANIKVQEKEPTDLGSWMWVQTDGSGHIVEFWTKGIN